MIRIAVVRDGLFLLIPGHDREQVDRLPQSSTLRSSGGRGAHGLNRSQDERPHQVLLTSLWLPAS